jgi:AAA domain
MPFPHNVAADVMLLLLQCTVSDIAVVTPYAAQARLIRRMTRRLINSTGPPFIEVSSVDGFQGREKEAVVFSAVRSNDFGQIGFTLDRRRRRPAAAETGKLYGGDTPSGLSSA